MSWMRLQKNRVLVWFLILSHIIGTTVTLAETTSNQIDNSTPSTTECEFGICPYQFPNIHMHVYIDTDTYNDGGIIYAGHGGMDYLASAEVDVTGVIPDGYDIDSVNWSIDVSSGYYSPNGGVGSGSFDDTITIDIDFKDINGDIIDDAGPGTFEATWGDGEWHNLNGTYTNETHLYDIDSVMMTIGGIDGAYNSDGIRFANMSITYDYSETVVIPEIMDEIIQDLIDLNDSGIALDDMTIADVVDTYIEDEEVAEEVSDALEDSMETEEETTEESSEEEESEASEEEEEEASEEEEEEEVTEEEEEETVEEETTDEEPTKEDPKKETPKTVTKTTTVKTTKSNNNIVNINEVIGTLDMIKNMNQEALQLALADTINFGSYTTQTYEDAVELEDNDNWYSDPAFYGDDGGVPDTQILDSYKYIRIEDNDNWYGEEND